jgi:hypothetical protein
LWYKGYPQSCLDIKQNPDAPALADGMYTLYPKKKINQFKVGWDGGRKRGRGRGEIE